MLANLTIPLKINRVVYCKKSTDVCSLLVFVATTVWYVIYNEHTFFRTHTLFFVWFFHGNIVPAMQHRVSVLLCKLHGSVWESPQRVPAGNAFLSASLKSYVGITIISLQTNKRTHFAIKTWYHCDITCDLNLSSHHDASFRIVSANTSVFCLDASANLTMSSKKISVLY